MKPFYSLNPITCPICNMGHAQYRELPDKDFPSISGNIRRVYSKCPVCSFTVFRPFLYQKTLVGFWYKPTKYLDELPPFLASLKDEKFVGFNIQNKFKLENEEVLLYMQSVLSKEGKINYKK